MLAAIVLLALVAIDDSADLRRTLAELQPILEAAGVKPDSSWNGYTGDPFEFLPKWMTKNPLRSK